MSARLRVSIGQYSDKGVKNNNEDSYGVLCPEGNQLKNKGISAIVADGMGSCSFPKEASEYCVKGFLSDYYSTPDSWSVKSSAAKVLTALNSWLYAKTSHTDAKGMVSTFSAMVIKSITVHLIHVGDSRIYRFRDGGLEQLTHDHRIWLSDNKNYLSRAMGIDLHLDIDYKTVQAEVGDVYIMTTDGVHDYLPDKIIKELLSGDGTLDDIAHNIVQHALENKSTDNVTCQLVRIDELPLAEANEVYNELARLPFPPVLEAGMILDGYRVVREIKASTTSQLYLVEDMPSGLLMVMKTPSVYFDDDPSYIERFYMEEWAGKRINNKNVIKTLDLKRPRHAMYFLLEYIEGETLKQWMERNPQPDIKTVTGLVDQIIQGLRGIHRMEMLHRDLKPDNILIDKRGVVKIIDLGSVKIAGVQEISTPVERLELLGTKNYTAPEYLLGVSGSNKSDLFSLGVIVYELLTGKLPYGDKLTREISWRTIYKIKYTTSLKYNPMIPVWLDGALEKAVRCDHRTRYDTLSEFYQDLTHPNESYMRKNVPLLEYDPVIIWKVVSFLLLLINLVLVYHLVTGL